MSKSLHTRDWAVQISKHNEAFRSNELRVMGRQFMCDDDMTIEAIDSLVLGSVVQSFAIIGEAL